MIVRKSQFIRILKEQYLYSLILEAQTPQGVASAIANYLRIKHSDLRDKSKNEALQLVNTAVFDMMKTKNLGGVETQKTLIILTVRDLMKTGDLKLDPKTAQVVTGRSAPAQSQPAQKPPVTQPPQSLGRLLLKKLAIPRRP